MKKVLVIMATYNGEKFLSEQLDSILQQKNVQVDILVRDDGSKDGTKKILGEYKKGEKIKWYEGEHLDVQKGYFELMKKAVTLKWDYIAFSDQDDVWDENKLFVAIENLDKITQDIPALYYCGQTLADSNLNVIAEHKLNNYRNFVARFVLSDFAGCTGVFNRKLLEKVVDFEPTYMMMHDTWVLKVCLCLGGQVVVDPETHMKYRQHGGNTVGLGRSIPAYLRQVKQYINEYHVEEQMHELMRGYGKYMVSDYKQLAVMLCEYRHNRKYKKKLLDRNYIDFCNKGLNLTYWLKVRLNRL